MEISNDVIKWFSIKEGKLCSKQNTEKKVYFIQTTWKISMFVWIVEWSCLCIQYIVFHPMHQFSNNKSHTWAQ